MIDLDKIYCDDCFNVLPSIDDHSVDFICCDLPYGVLAKGNEQAKWDVELDLERLWSEYCRIIKDNGAIALFGQGMFTARLMLSNPRMWRYNLVWDKVLRSGFLNARRCPLRQHEDICIFYKKLPVYHPQYTIGKKNHPTGNGAHRNGNNCYGDFVPYNDENRPKTKEDNEKYPTSIIRIPKEKGKKVMHPTQKPVELIRWLVRTYTDEGDVVLDNCCGSGTVAVAAKIEKRHYICIEKDPRFAELATERVENNRE